MSHPHLMVAMTLYGVAICQGLAAAEPVVQPSSAAPNQQPVGPIPSSLTPAQQAAALAELDRIRNEHDRILSADSSVAGQVEARRLAENEEWISRITGFSGSNPDRAAALLDLGGGYSLHGKWQRSPRHMRETRFIGPQGQFDIVEQGANVLDDYNRTLNRMANKIEKSKFACGNFDWVTQLRHAFTKAALTKYVDNLSESAVAAAPMALLANFSPTLYEIVKWLRLNAADLINADKVNCTNIENAMTNIGQRMIRGEGYPECIRANKALGTTEAHRLCTQENSPFDGVENMVGQIVGLATKNETISVTGMLAEGIRSPGPDGLPLKAEKQREAQDRLDKARVDAAAAPDPGPLPPAAQAGTDARRAWEKARARHLQTQAELKEATNNLQYAITDRNNTAAGTGTLSSFMDQLRNGIADNLTDIIGDIRISAKVDIQFGLQRQYHLNLKHKHSIDQVALTLTGRLETHFPILMRLPSDRDLLAESYNSLRAFCFGSMQAPWSLDQPADIRNAHTAYFGDPAKSVAFTYDTLDKLSYLWTMHQAAPPEGVERTVWPTQYRFVECINHISAYEVYDYLYRKGLDQVDAIMEQVTNLPMSKQPGGERIPAQVQASVDEYLAMLLRKRNEQIRPLMETIAAVNTFQIRRGARPTEHPDRIHPDFTVPDIQLGR